jgi:hypothetical protein
MATPAVQPLSGERARSRAQTDQLPIPETDRRTNRDDRYIGGYLASPRRGGYERAAILTTGLGLVEVEQDPVADQRGTRQLLAAVS